MKAFIGKKEITAACNAHNCATKLNDNSLNDIRPIIKYATAPIGVNVPVEISPATVNTAKYTNPIIAGFVSVNNRAYTITSVPINSTKN